STGYSDNIISNFKQWWQTNVDIRDQRDIYFATHRNVTWNPATSEPGSAPIFWDNPYWTRYENYQNDGRNRFIGNFELSYDVTEWFNILRSVSTDTYNENQEERRANGSVASPFGVARGNSGSGYLRRDIVFTETNYDLMLNFDTDITESISFAGILGSNIRRTEFDRLTSSTSGGLEIPFLYALNNSVGESATAETAEKFGVDGVYASASFGFANTVFLDGTWRNDTFSTLPKENNNDDYFGVSTSFVFSKLLNVDAITFGKLRANYAEVGNGGNYFGRLATTYDINNDIGTSVPNSANNPNLEVELTKSYEVGLEMRFAKNRIGFDVSYYKANTFNQLFNTPVSAATGYTSKLINAGELENKGIEASLNLVPIKSDSFTWNLNANFTKNENTVVELYEDIENIQLGRFQGGVSINAIPGQPFGVIYGTDYTYHENGQKLVDED